ncbi:MAG TPA: glycosyltransferase family 2 protein [Polyangiales bacterium]|jgi:GT2 family glycosyltransferase|nr:glycosyltransferase family 2 protein [Polyangiales bacterium]
MQIKVGIATAGRRAMLTQTLEQLGLQKRLPDEVILCPSTPEDCDEAALARLPYACRVVRGPRGLSAQRNAIVAACTSCDILVFFDDDFYPAADYLDNLERLFTAQPDIVGATGHVVVDGAISHGVSHDEALEILNAHPAPGVTAKHWDVYNLYGCNMALRMAPVLQNGLRFDERLPLYGWLEDVDLSRQIARYGRLIKTRALAGVHLAIKNGRNSGLRIGYSQIANPWYLMWKGTLAPKRALRQVSRNVAANAYHSLHPEPWVDRRGRLQGNALATWHLLLGRLDPSKVLELHQ